MVSVVLLELTTEYTVRKPEACSPLRASPSLEYTEEENLMEYLYCDEMISQMFFVEW